MELYTVESQYTRSFNFSMLFFLGWEVPLASGLQPSPRSWLGLFALSSQWVLCSAWLELPSDSDNKDFLVPIQVFKQNEIGTYDGKNPAGRFSRNHLPTPFASVKTPSS